MGLATYSRLLVGLKLAPQRVDLRLEVLLTREETILSQQPILKVGERTHDTRQVGRDALGEII